MPPTYRKKLIEVALPLEEMALKVHPIICSNPLEVET